MKRLENGSFQAKIRQVVNLCGDLAGAKRLACIWVVSWQERSDWLVFGCGGELAGAKRLACIVLVLLF